MRYPIDPLTAESFFGHLVSHDRAQRQLITALYGILKDAIADENVMDDAEWLQEAQQLIRIQAKINTEHETRIFNARNGHPDNHTVKLETPENMDAIQPIAQSVSIPGVQLNPEQNARLNEAEKDFGEELSEADLARMFGEKPSKAKKEVDLGSKTPFKGMTLDEIEAWEAKQNNSNDIYKIKARVQNLAVAISGGNLTATGEMMANTFVHVLKDLYDFAETIPDKSLKISLIEKIRKHEEAPGNLIAAAHGGVKIKK